MGQINKNQSSKNLRHPEKVENTRITSRVKKPDWIRVKAPNSTGFFKTRKLIQDSKLSTVCEEASCPNIGECWAKGHATVMIMGEICTRACGFCNVSTGKPKSLDPFEPARVGEAVNKLNLEHVVITSVDRDDLPDGGANHIASTIRAIKRKSKNTSVEVLTPDFLKCGPESLEIVIDAKPDVFNHNMETVPSMYASVRPGARYFASLRLLQRAKELNPQIFTKSGLMVGLGEKKSEVVQVMDDLRAADIDFLTIGQYLQPTSKHLPVAKFVTPIEFKAYEKIARGKGFLMVSATPLTRSSYHAASDFLILKEQRSLLKN